MKRRGICEGSIYRRSDGKWCATLAVGYDQNGKRKRRYLYGRTKAEVLEKLGELKGKHKAGITAVAFDGVDRLTGDPDAIGKVRLGPIALGSHHLQPVLHADPFRKGLAQELLISLRSKRIADKES